VDRRAADLRCRFPFGRLWYAGPNAIGNAVGYAEHRSRSHDAVIRVYDAAGNVIETYEHAGEFKEWWIATALTCNLRLHYLLVRSFASVITAHAASGCELVDRSVVIIAPMNGSAVKISEPIDDHAVIRERAIRRALERMNYGLGPLTAANRT
jgi:hypothetical protein